MGFGDGSGISWTICKQSAPRSRQITTLNVLQAVCSSWCPTNSVKALKAISKLNCYVFYFRRKHASWQLCFILDQLFFWEFLFFALLWNCWLGVRKWCIDVIGTDSHSNNQAIGTRRAAVSDVYIRLLLRLCDLRLGCAWTIPHQGLLHTHTHTHLTAIVRDYPGELVPDK